MSTNAVEIVTKLSPWSVDETVSRLSAVVAARGMKLFAIVDHSGEAEAVGLELRNTKLVIFGSPQAGTPVMQAAPSFCPALRNPTIRSCCSLETCGPWVVA